jgi:class 3 adenylate cyclase
MTSPATMAVFRLLGILQHLAWARNLECDPFLAMPALDSDRTREPLHANTLRLGHRGSLCYRGAVRVNSPRGHAGATVGHRAQRLRRSRLPSAVVGERDAVRLLTGTLTFLFTDIENSTSAWIRNPDAMRVALPRHDELIEKLVSDHAGQLVRPRGEGGQPLRSLP